MKPTNTRNYNLSQELQQQWERGIERATEEQPTHQELGGMLNEAAGLHIKSGAQAGGLWGSTSCSCVNSCDCSNIC